MTGAFCFSGAVSMLSAHGETMYLSKGAAELVDVTPDTIRNWRRRGLLQPDGMDERGNPAYLRRTVTEAERLVREIGLERTGRDPRRMRKPKPRAA